MPDGTELSRRRFISLAATAAGLLAPPAAAALEDVHRPRLRVPTATSNGARVPIVVDVPHPMTPDHRITTIQVINARDPVPVKGTFEFSPASGRAYVAFQARFDEGASAVTATAECGRHGRFSATATVTIAEGGGGCAGGAPAIMPPDDIRPPVIRIPQLVADGRITRDDVIDVQVKTKHPNRTGLAARGGAFVQESEPFHLSELVVVYGGEPVTRFLLTAALSDNPFLMFKLRVRREEMLRVVLTNNRGQRFEANQPISFA